MVVFGHESGQGYTWDDFVVLWDTSDCFALCGAYLGSIDGYFCSCVVCGNWKVPDLIIFYGFC